MSNTGAVGGASEPHIGHVDALARSQRQLGEGELVPIVDHDAVLGGATDVFPAGSCERNWSKHWRGLCPSWGKCIR